MELTQKQLAFIALLQKLGVFDVKQGMVTLAINFDANGVIGSVAVTTTQHYKP